MSTNSPLTNMQEGDLSPHRMAVLILLGLTVAMLVVLASVGTHIYHQQRDLLQQEAEKKNEAASKTELPAGAEKPKEVQPETLTPGRAFKAMMTSPWFLWALVNALGTGVAALWLATVPAGSSGSAEASPMGAATGSAMPSWLQLLLLGVGGLFGFTTVIFIGMGNAFSWYSGISRGLEKWPGRAAFQEGRFWLIAAAVLGGMFLMFISLALVRSQERQQAGLRRLIYGYNTVLMGFLVLAILIVVNAVFAVYAPAAASDWTAGRLYSIQPATRQALAAMEKPVRLYVLLSDQDELYTDMKNMLDAAQGVTKQLDVRYFQLNSRKDVDEINGLIKKYALSGDVGVLVVLDPDTKNELHQFIKRTADSGEEVALESRDFRGGMGGGSRQFRGEQALVSTINFLDQGKVKTTIYFTQENGEPDLEDRKVPGENVALEQHRGMGSLRDKLERSNYVVKPLALFKEGAPGKVPDDAFAVVVVGPSNMTPAKVGVLDEYMQRPAARMLVMVDVNWRGDQVVLDGMETFLAKYGVQVTNDIIISRWGVSEMQDPGAAVVGVARGSDPAVVRPLDAAARQPFPLYEARSVRPNPAPVGNYTATPFLITLPGQQFGQWAETGLAERPHKFWNRLAEDKELTELKRKITNSAPIPVGVTVREKKAAAPEAGPAGAAPGTPKLVVIGDGTGATNFFIERDQFREVYYNLVSGSLAWLREKPDIPRVDNIEARTRKSYRLNLPADEVTSVTWLPLVAFLGLIIACGVGVGLLRRR